MDLGVLLESPQGSQSSSRMRACTCAFLQSGSSRVTQTTAWRKGSMVFPRVFPTRLSHEAFPRGFPTGLSNVHTWWESILGLNVKAVLGNRFLWNGLTHLGDSWNGGTTLECLSPFLWRAPSLEMRRAAWIKGSMAFPRGFPTRLSHRAVSRATVVGVDPRHERRGSAGKICSSGMD